MEKISPWVWLPVGLIGFAMLRSRQDDDVLGALGQAWSDAYDGIPRTLRADYQTRWPVMRVRPERMAAADVAARRMASREARYRAITDPIGVPWWWLAAVHELEHSGRFTISMVAVDPIDAPPGTAPPSGTITDAEWDDTARSLLRARGLASWRDWTIPGALYQWERFNGLGYRNFDVPSPYLWAFSDQYNAGKFIRAGVFSRTTVSAQPGAAVLLRRLIDVGTVTV